MLFEHHPSRLGGVLGEIVERERRGGHVPVLGNLSEGDAPVQLRHADLVHHVLDTGEGRCDVPPDVAGHDQLGTGQFVGEQLERVAFDPQLAHQRA